MSYQYSGGGDLIVLFIEWKGPSQIWSISQYRYIAMIQAPIQAKNEIESEISSYDIRQASV